MNKRSSVDGQLENRSPVRRYRWVRGGLGLLCLAGVVWQGLGFAIAYDYLHRDHHQLTPLDSPAARGLPFVDLRIPVDEEAEGQASLDLAAWLLPADTKSVEYQEGAIIVMLHGFGSSRAKIWEDPSTGYRGSQLDQGGEALWKAGFHVLMLDFRNHGDSGDRGVVTLGLNESRDVDAAIRYIESELANGPWGIDATRIGLRGSSMGGATALIAASGAGERIDAVWADSAFANSEQAVNDFLSHFDVPELLMPAVRFWLQQLSGISFSELQPVNCISMIRCPTMLVHSQDDTMIRVQHFKQYASKADELPHVETWLLSGVQHNRLWSMPNYRERQTAFFLQHLGKP